MAHAFVTVVVPFDDLKAGDVRAHLRALGNPARAPIADPLNRGMFVHFMSLTVVPGSPAGPAHLVLEVSADGHPRSAIGRLVGAIGPRLRELLGVAGVVLSDSQVGAFLGQHERQVGSGWFAVPGVVFAGTPGMTVERILREQELATDIQARLDAPHPQNSALETLQWLRAQLFDAGDYKWAFVAEQVPLLQEGGIESFFRREVLPYTPDAWIKADTTKIGYEISFTRHFYQPQPLRMLDQIRADILAVEKEAEGLLDELLKGGAK